MDPHADTLFLTSDGPNEGGTVVLLHGLGASARSWESMVPLLAARHHVVRIDLAGHGRSPAPPDGRYDVDAHAHRVAAALDRAGITAAVVVGHSTGGIVAVALAEQRPDLVDGLVLVGTGPGLHALTAPDVAVEPSRWPHLTDQEIRGAMSAAVSRPGYVLPQALVDDVRAMTYEAFAATLAGTHDYLRTRTLPERLDGLGTPLLVLVGADDRRWRPSSAADYEVVPGAVVRLLAGLGHSPILEDPERTAAPLLEFTARTAQGTPAASSSANPPRSCA